MPDKNVKAEHYESDTKKIIDKILNPEPEEIEKDLDAEMKTSKFTENIRVHTVCGNNVVENERYKEVQLSTMESLSRYLANTYGPMGSYTEIVLGNDQDTVHSIYSKDGLTVLKHLYFNQPIECTIRDEIEEICRYVETKVGDGTTSAVILSYHIFKELLKIERKHKVMPRTIVTIFKKHVELCQDYILKHKRECTLGDIYKICMISTNGNEEISQNISQIYQEHGLNVDIEVSISNDADNKLREYDGVTIDEGYSDPAYINNVSSGTADIHNAKVYYFTDPADDINMISLFEKILHDNIFVPVNQGKQPIPTVIMVPKLSRDSSAMLNKLIEILHQYDVRNMSNQKPQVLVITNYVGADEGIAFDIARLCDCKEIKKYINPEHEEHDKQAGLAATPENVHEFAGTAELVVGDSHRTKFINPKTMIENPDVYNGLINFLETQLKRAQEENEDPLTIGRIKSRLRRLKTNNVEYFIGGIAISDRDALRDLVIDAVKNCKSAAAEGVGYAANFEGMRAALNLCKAIDPETNPLYYDVAECILKAYIEASTILYSTVMDRKQAEIFVKNSLLDDKPYNLSDIASGYNGNILQSDVLCSIMTDVTVLDAISRIITIMATSNQCLLQSTDLNRY